MNELDMLLERRNELSRQIKLINERIQLIRTEELPKMMKNLISSFELLGGCDNLYMAEILTKLINREQYISIPHSIGVDKFIEFCNYHHIPLAWTDKSQLDRDGDMIFYKTNIRLGEIEVY